MKNLIKYIPSFLLIVISSQLFAAQFEHGYNEFKAKVQYNSEMQSMQKISETELFLEDNFKDQETVELPGIKCIQAEKTKTEVEPAVGGVITKRITYKGFTCEYTK
ncbi:hypothetical protein [Pseudomonas ficuserectae]|uniref:hypothetical protein n=1 Tax=Pseudomonas ficuserectae TaxID=53410 RepID=UPI0006D6106B|nr:hypothetical protein [Pseudomonas ficuserectae]KPX25802.1 hypothetical protein ALO69_200014 [Pseudomonas ficuserectae]